jgi:elongation factor G
MDMVSTKQIRNICLLGHGSAGKTSVAEAMLYISGGTDRLGTVGEGNTVLDYDPEEARRGYSVQAAVAPVMWKDTKINVIDAPGYLGFAGEVKEAVRVADSAVIVVDGKAGIEVGTELAWDAATDAGIPKAFFVNKFDDPECRFNRVFTELHDAFGVSVCPLMIPMVEGDKVEGFIKLIDKKTYVYDKEGSHTEAEIPAGYEEVVDRYRDMLFEAIAGVSDELMEKYFAGIEIGYDEAIEAIHQGIIHGSIVPVLCGAATKTWGVETLLDTIAESFPRHTAKETERGQDGEPIAIDRDSNEPAIFIFKTVADPFVGKMSLFKVMTGTLTNQMTLRNLRTGTEERMARIYTLKGKKQTEVDSLACGDIGMIAKLSDTETSDTLALSPNARAYAGISFPEPFYSRAIVPKAKGDEDKIASGIARLLEEDYTARFVNDAETKQLVLSGMGDIHVDVLVSKLKNRYGVSVDMSEPKIAYRESIRRRIDAEGKHKKQSGGHGQYGHVKIHFAPSDEPGLHFTESVVGGAVPKNFFPAVEKGLQDSMQKGVLAGFPMMGLSADLYDGSYHDVDSSEMSFKVAAGLAYKELVNADPVLLEPVGELRVEVPGDDVGDVMSDLNKRRGRVLGIDPSERKKNWQTVVAEVPKAEMSDYTVALRAITQGMGSYTYRPVRYEEVPAAAAQKIIAAAKSDAQE